MTIPDPDLLLVKGSWTRCLGADLPKRHAVAVLMAAFNAIDTIHRAMARIDASGEVDEYTRARDRGDRLRLFLIAIGYLKEASHSFRDLGPEIARAIKKQDDEALTEDLATAARLLKDGSGLWKAIDRLRNDAAFHFQRKPLIQAIELIDQGPSQILAITRHSGGQFRTRFVLADAAVAIAAGMPADKEEMATLMSDLSDAMRSFLGTTAVFLAEHMGEHGAIAERK